MAEDTIESRKILLAEEVNAKVRDTIDAVLDGEITNRELRHRLRELLQNRVIRNTYIEVLQRGERYKERGYPVTLDDGTKIRLPVDPLKSVEFIEMLEQDMGNDIQERYVHSGQRELISEQAVMVGRKKLLRGEARVFKELGDELYG